MVVTSEQMLRLEEQAFEKGVSAKDLMERAGVGIAKVVTQFSPQPGTLILILGRGNNAGDALVAARELAKTGWRLKARCVYEIDDFKPLPRAHWDALDGVVELVNHLSELERESGELVILDGLLGVGFKGKARDEVLEVIEEVNRFREKRHATVVAMDLPSGLEGNLVHGSACIKADVTATVGLVKSVLLEDQATNFVGRLALVELPVLQQGADLRGESVNGEKNGIDRDRKVIFPAGLLNDLQKRDFDFHKGQAGRVGIVAGSKGTLGASVLAARGALRGGGGLITVYAKPDIYELLAVKMPTEVMVKPVTDYSLVAEDRLDALVIGPGLGKNYTQEIVNLILAADVPMVLDADGLNMAAEAGLEMIFGSVKVPVLLTPHPGEMSRLIQNRPEWETLNRAALARAFIEAFPQCVLLLKGARTVIAGQNQSLAFNSTGSPGMASGGMGDVLSGLLGALIAGGMKSVEAACLGAWLTGRAAEIALTNAAASQESLSASDVADHLGQAFTSLKRLDF